MMRKAAIGLGDVAGGFGAAFLVYIVVGGLLGMAIAVPFDGKQGCWPTALYSSYSAIAANCEDALAGAFWFGTVEMPNSFILYPVAALHLLTPSASGDSYGLTTDVADMTTATLGAMLVALLSFIGFRHLLSRNVIVAWLLVLALLGQIAVMASQL